MAKRGRPRGLHLNPEAFADLIEDRGVSKGEIAEVAGITTGHLADALYRQKGISPTAVKAMSVRLRCSPGTLAPELTKIFMAFRAGDDIDERALV